jgi:hypothetical protein
VEIYRAPRWDEVKRENNGERSGLTRPLQTEYACKLSWLHAAVLTPALSFFKLIAR